MQKRVKAFSIALFIGIAAVSSVSYAQIAYEKRVWKEGVNIWCPSPVGTQWTCPTMANTSGDCVSGLNPAGRCRDIRIVCVSPYECGPSETKCERCVPAELYFDDEVKDGLCWPRGVKTCDCFLDPNWRNLGSKTSIWSYETVNPCAGN